MFQKTCSMGLEFKTKHNWLYILSKAKSVALDTESNGLDEEYINGEGYCLGFSIATRVDGILYSEYIPVGHRRISKGGTANALRELWAPILQLVTQRRVVMHNARYDKRVIDSLGYTINTYVDTTRLSHLENESAIMKRSLNNCVKHYVGNGHEKNVDQVMQGIIDVLGWGMLSYDEIKEYGENDAKITWLLYEGILEKLKKNKELETTMKYWDEFEIPNFDALYAMKTRGVKIDLSKCVALEKKGLERTQELIGELGFDPAKPKQLADVLYNKLNLPVIYAKRKKSDGTVIETPTLDKGAMERYDLMLERKQNPIARTILEYRGWTKAVSSYYKNYQTLIYPDGRLRPDYLSHGTKTGRFSCAKPNLQQIPKESDKPWNGQLKELFIAQEGYELWEFDYSQLEFRMGAHYSKEPKLLDVFNDDSRDIFTEMSIDLGLTRQECKTLTYSINYGAGVPRIMDAFGVDAKTAKAHIERFYTNYPYLRAVNLYVQNLAKNNGKVKYWSGRYRHYDNKGDAFKAFNSFIQGGGADIVKHVMNRIHREVPDARMLMQVHDSLVFELPVGDTVLHKAIVNVMENPFPDDPWLVHFKVDGHRMGEG